MSQLQQLQEQLKKVKSTQSSLPAAPTAPLTDAQMYGAAGRGSDNYSPATTKAIETASAAGVPMSALGDKNSTGKTNIDTPACLLYTSPSPRDGATSRMPSSA